LFSLDVTATSESQFYLLELVKLLVPVAGIALIFLATIRRYRGAWSPRRVGLAIVVMLWLVITLLSQVAFSSPVRHHYMSAAITQFEPGQQREMWYFTVSSWLWTAEQIMLLLFGVALFLAFREESSMKPREHI
jgi:hypothetical protein